MILLNFNHSSGKVLSYDKWLLLFIVFVSFDYIQMQDGLINKRHYKNNSQQHTDIESSLLSVNSAEEQSFNDHSNLEYEHGSLQESSSVLEQSTKRSVGTRKTRRPRKTSVGTRKTRRPRKTFSTTVHPRLDIVPKLMIFEPDRVLWPFHYESEVVLPYDLIQPTAWPLPKRKGHRWWTGNFGGRDLVDNNGKCLRLNHEALVLFLKLRHRGIQLALTATINNSSNIVGMKHLIRLFEFEDLFNYSEIDENSALDHVQLIKEKSGLEFRDLVYFGINKTILENLHKEIQIITVHVNSDKGLGEEDVQEGARLYAIRPHVPGASEPPLTVGKIVSDEEAANIYGHEVMNMCVEKSEESTGIACDKSDSERKMDVSEIHQNTTIFEF